MPELPEVENVVRGLRPFLDGRRFVSIEVLNPAIIKEGAERFKDTVSGCVISSIVRRGKYIVFDLQGGQFLVFHLGMTGKLYFSAPADPREKHTHLIFAIESLPRELRHVDSRRFGGAYLYDGPGLERFKRLHRLGPDPLELSYVRFAELIKKRNARIKALLLDQSTLAGLGNIYCDESLHRAGIHPCRLASGLNPQELRGLFLQIQRVLRKAIEKGGSSISDYVDAEGYQGQYQNYYRVYGRDREPCKRKNCPGVIRRIQVAGRSSHYCPECQRRRGRRPALQRCRPAGRNQT
jgi:formamidopyrimidine-DNA glycosylase